MKESGIDWIGQIPQEWEVTKLKYALLISNGKDYKDIEIEEGGYPVIGSGGVFARSRNYMYDGDVVLLGRKGTIDKPLFYSGKFWTVDTMFYSTALNGNNIKFMYYSSLLIPFSYYSTATALPSMTQSDLNNHMLCLPSISEQQKIADFLDKKTAQLDKVKSLLEEQIQKLKDYRASLIYETVTKGLDKTVPMKDSGIDWIGQVPEGWGVKRLKYLVNKIGSGKTPLGGSEIFEETGILFIRSQNVHNGLIQLEDKSTYINRNIHRQMIGTSVEKNDILLNITGASIGRVAKYDLDVEANVNQHVCIIRCDRFVLPDYLMYFIMSEFGQFMIKIHQISGNREGLSFDNIGNFKIIIPDLDYQYKISQYLNKKMLIINQMIKTKDQQIENINKQRQTLIYDYVTGKRRV